MLLLVNLYSIVSFAPIALILHCLFIFLFKRWLGPIGTFYASAMSFGFVLFFSIIEMYQVMLYGNYTLNQAGDR